MHPNIIHPDPALAEVHPAQASMQPNLVMCEKMLAPTRHRCTQAHNFKHWFALNWRWGAPPAGNSSRQVHH